MTNFFPFQQHPYVEFHMPGQGWMVQVGLAASGGKFICYSCYANLNHHCCTHYLSCGGRGKHLVGGVNIESQKSHA